MAATAVPPAVSTCLQVGENTPSKESTIKEKSVEESKVEVVDEGQVEAASTDDDFPDGGLRAWLVVVGAMCNGFATSGFVASWGVFQAYYESSVLSSSSPSNIAWIGSVQYFLVFFPCIFVGRLFDIGYFRSVLITSTVTLAVATFLIPYCTEYWHFLMCQGFGVGLPCGCIFGQTTTVPAHWFKKKRGLAMGCYATSGSLGGTILPIAARNLLPKVGFKWTMRILGFILLAFMCAADILMKRRLPPRKAPGGMFNWQAFKYAPYTLYCLSAFVTFQGVYSFLTYIAVSATEIGVPEDFAFYFVTFVNVSSLFGRYCAGSIGDRFGPMNVMIPFISAAGILTYAWPFAQSKGSLIAVTLLYGFASGAYISVACNPAMDFGGPEDVGRRVGMFLTCLAFGALSGPPISGAIRSASGGFKAVGYYSGTVVLLGVGLMCLARHLALGRLVGRL